MLLRTRPRGPRSRFLPRIEALEVRITPASLIAISDASIAEGDSGSVMMEFTVSRTGDLTVPVTVGYTTADGTAQAGMDYTAETGTVSIPAGATSTTIAIPVIGNLLLQADRSFSVTLTGADGGPRAAGFGVQQPFSTGFGPFSVAVGDFNSDGKPDLAVANDNANTVSVLLNTTAPGATTSSFAPRQDFATATNPVSVVVGDFNLDNKPDLAIVEQGSGLVSVLLNTTEPGAATASFAPRQDFLTGASPVSAAVGDFNGDGEPDLAVANQGSNSVSVLLNTTAAGATHAQLRRQARLRHRVDPQFRCRRGLQRRQQPRPGCGERGLEQGVGPPEHDRTRVGHSELFTQDGLRHRLGPRRSGCW